MVLNVVMPSSCTFSLGKWVDIVAFAQLLFQWRRGGHDFHPLLLLMSLPVGNMAELEKVFLWKAHKLLTPSSLLACKNVEQTEHNAASRSGSKYG